MADNSIVRTIKNAEVDARSLSGFMYKPASDMIERRLASPIHTLNYYIEYMDSLAQTVSTTIDSVIAGQYQTEYAERLTELESRGSAKMFSKARVVFNAPLTTDAISQAIAQNNYKWVSLQSVIPVDSLGVLLVQYYAELTSGSDHKVWFAAYNIDNPDTPIAHFSTDGWGAEGGYAKVVNNQIYLVQQSKSGADRELGVYVLPVDLENANNNHYSPLYSYTGRFGTCVGGFGDSVIVEQTPGGLVFERNNLRVYDFNSLISGNLGEPLASISLSNAYLQTKPQGISIGSNGVYTGSGGAWWVDRDLDLNYSALTIAQYTPDGTMSKSLTMHPERFLNKLEPIVPNSREKVENEGVFVSSIEGSERLYGTYLLGDRVVVLEHNADDIDSNLDMSNVATSTLNGTVFDTRSVVTSTPVDKVTGKRLSSWADIARYMKKHNINKYVFYDDGNITRPSEIPDTNYTQIEFYGNMGFTTYQFNVQSHRKSMSGSFQYPSDSTGLDGKVFMAVLQQNSVKHEASNSIQAILVDGQTGMTFYNQVHPTAIKAITFKAHSTGEEVGNITYGDGITSFNTTSDPRVKTSFKEHTTAIEDFESIASCLGVYSFKSSPDKEHLGFDAHKLIDTGLGIATEGNGGRELPIGSVYGVDRVETPEGVDEKELLVTPASVDYSKVVPYLVSAIERILVEMQSK